MITGFFLNVLLVLLNFFFGLVPPFPMPAPVLSSLTFIVGLMNAWTWLFPVGTLLTVVGLSISFHLALVLFDLAIWIIHLIRGK